MAKLKHRYYFRNWREEHAGQGLLYVSLGRWFDPVRLKAELPNWPRLGRVFKWEGKLPELWYYIKCRLWKRYNTIKIKTLPPTWSDRDEVILHGMFQVLEDVVEKEDWFNRRTYRTDDYLPDSTNYWDGSEEWQEVATLYDWWVNRRPARVAARDRQLTEWHDAFMKAGGFRSVPIPGSETGLSRLEAPTGELADVADVLKQAHSMGEFADAEEDEAMLIRLVKIRQILWT